MPYFFIPCWGRPGWRLAETDEEWLHGVYADDALVTQLNGDDDAALAARRGQTVEGRPTSSSSVPSLMATMLHRDETDGASGAFLAQYGGFMAVRSVPEPAAPKIRPHLLDAAQPTEVPPAALTDAHPAAFHLSLCCPCPYKTLGFTPDDNSTGLQTWGQGADGSTFVLTIINDTTHVAAEGPLWDTLETGYAQWSTRGRPDRDRFGVTAAQARQWVWLDHPDHVITELDEL